MLKEEIEHTFGIPIDYYILVDLEGFIALVDELGMIGGREKGWVRMYLKFDKF